ncbi:hypothetical protein HMI48_00830 [Acidithiobacillus ferrooxidans]|uniref:hypothetical protein n=1 Tax=Acidithiobacillus ferrooxidans TaxID=920 RepID=UPI001C07721D|nr:hypothetical protein [Acidithiobacillus ferrooxidans]MBU2772506.1 hypothetical protein [Acidithiobacillus ferrooxidans]
MLHAIHHHKSRLPAQRYVASANARGPRRTQEDEITSTVFGPLDFMQAATQGKIIAALFGREPLPETNSISIEFWPCYGNVEPDVVFFEHLKNGDKNAYIIEVKWNAPLGADQVGRQIADAQSIEGIRDTSHIVLSRHVLEVDTPSKNVTWMDFKDRIIALKQTFSKDHALDKWANLTVSFLEECNIQHFRGFGMVPVSDMSEQHGESVIFWPGFQGWDSIELPDELFRIQCGDKNIFWKTA